MSALESQCEDTSHTTYWRLLRITWSNGTGADGIETLGVSAQYDGLEFITHGGATDRVGLNEVVFSTIPEPSSSTLLGLAGLALILWRRK